MTGCGLFRLASDLAISSFGNRQVLYERFYASDPLSRARALAAIYPEERSYAARARISEARRRLKTHEKRPGLQRMLLQPLVRSSVLKRKFSQEGRC